MNRSEEVIEAQRVIMSKRQRDALMKAKKKISRLFKKSKKSKKSKIKRSDTISRTVIRIRTTRR